MDIYKQKKTVFLFRFITVFALSHGQDFGYEGNKGPSHWGNTCVGKYQSPIDINSLTVKYAQLPPLRIHDYNISNNQTIIKNNGHTVMISIESDERPTISGGPLNGSYEFSQLHFHWGENDTMGSEDSIDGHSFPVELHMVFYKKTYRNVRSAMENSDGLTVLAFFFHLDDVDNPNYVEIVEILPKISVPGMVATLTRTNSIQDFILPELNEYYTYHGSLTTPPCSEVVTWIDFKQSIPLSHAQIEEFRYIQDIEGHHLTHNFRPIQPLGDRDVYFISPLTRDDNIPFKEPLQGVTPHKYNQTIKPTTTVGNNDNRINSQRKLSKGTENSGQFATESSYRLVIAYSIFLVMNYLSLENGFKI